MQILEIDAPRKDGIGTSMTAPSIFFIDRLSIEFIDRLSIEKERHQPQSVGSHSWGGRLMLTMVIGAAFCCVPLAVLLGQFIPARRPSQQCAANDNFSSQERSPPGRIFNLVTPS
jgi:hypothetical protein